MSAVEPTGKRLPLFDGIRAVAICFVLVGHLILRQHVAAGSVVGGFGVAVFFTLSGYLITRSMVADENANGRLRLGRFYVRRAFRIFPAFYFFLAILFLLSLLGIRQHIDPKTWIASAAYFRNCVGSGWETSHLWSLALEEQFYFFWPLMFVLTRGRRLKSIAFAVLGFTVWRSLWVWSHFGAMVVIADVGGLYFGPDLRLDTFLIGGAFAIADWNWVRSAPVHCIGAGLFIWSLVAIDTRLLLPVDTAVTAFGVAAIIAWLVANPNTATARFLSRPWPVRIGVLSYSIYLWQQLFLGPYVRWWSLSAIALVSMASYTLIERPFLRLRDGRSKPRPERSRSVALSPAPPSVWAR